MSTRHATTILLLASIFLSLALFLLGGPRLVPPAAAAAPRAAPIVTAVDPTSSYNDVDTQVTITGIGFGPGSSARMGTTFLRSVTLISSNQLTAVVPWGMAPGVYALTVTNADGQSGTLSNAFTVGQAIGIWTTNGPYGGQAQAVAVSPNISSTAFAAMAYAGLFRTANAGDSWQQVVNDTYPWGVGYGMAPTYTLYYWGSTGIWRSGDDGLSFQNVITPGTLAFAPDPVDPQHLWSARRGGVYDTPDGGTNWFSHSTGLPTTVDPSYLAVSPADPATLYVAFRNGTVYKTVNSGSNWDLISGDINLTGVTDAATKIAINPFDTNLLLYTRKAGAEAAHRSENGGLNWTPLLPAGSGKSISDFAFSPTNPGAVYGLTFLRPFLLAVSSDAGLNWSAYGTDPGDGTYIGLDPTNGLPAYIGSGTRGMWRSRDGGMTWQISNQGIAAVSVQQLAVPRGNPDVVYAAAIQGYTSPNGGHSWRDLNCPISNADVSLAAVGVDDPNVIYLSRSVWTYCRSKNGGQAWEQFSYPFPGTYASLRALEVDPTSAAVLYAAGGLNASFNAGQNQGLVFKSVDYASTWVTLTISLPISQVWDIAINPANHGQVYIGAGAGTSNMSPHPGKGVFYSPDSGSNWEARKNGMGDVTVFSLAVHPLDPRILYASAWLSSEGKVTVFKSVDAGSNWTPTAFRMSWMNSMLNRGMPLALDPTSVDRVYVGTPIGLFQTMDGGNTWTKVPELGSVGILALATGSDGNRTSVYVSTPGGFVTGLAPTVKSASTAATYIPAGVLKLTSILHGPGGTLYLPLISR